MDEETLEPVQRGRLFQLKLRRNAAARKDALASIRPRPQGNWQVRIGGRVRGRWLVLPTRAAAERAANDHYNAAMQAYLGIGGEAR